MFECLMFCVFDVVVGCRLKTRCFFYFLTRMFCPLRDVMCLLRVYYCCTVLTSATGSFLLGDHPGC